MLRVCVGVRPVSVDWQTAGAHEWSSSLGGHPASLPAGFCGHRVRLQPSNSHRLPAHPVCAGTTCSLSYRNTCSSLMIIKMS